MCVFTYVSWDGLGWGALNRQIGMDVSEGSTHALAMYGGGVCGILAKSVLRGCKQTIEALSTLYRIPGDSLTCTKLCLSLQIYTAQTIKF